jgi:AcrR family transcriptional regulator
VNGCQHDKCPKDADRREDAVVSNETGDAPAPRRGRGRPARLSREQIIEVSVALVSSDPATPLTVKRVAEAVGSAPMALYRYFPERDDLLHAVADRVANAMTFDPPRGATWQEQVRAWMHTSLEHLRPYPQLVPYIAATTQATWLPSFRLLMKVLKPAGLADGDMALAITVIGNVIVGQALLDARRQPPADVVAAMRERLADEGGPRAEHVAKVLAHVPEASGRSYDMVIEGVITFVEGRGSMGAEPKAPRSALTPLFSSTGQYP